MDVVAGGRPYPAVTPAAIAASPACGPGFRPPNSGAGPGISCPGDRDEAESNSTDLPDGVAGAVRVLDPEGAFGVVAPFSVDQESVMVSAWFQLDRSRPDSGFAFSEADRFLLPVGEVAYQLNAHRDGSTDGEVLLVFS